MASRLVRQGHRPRQAAAMVSFVAPMLAAALGLLVATTGIRGSDWPAQLFRIELFDQVGFTLWNGQWYGGHYTLGYSVLFPVVASWFGPMIVGFVSSLIATTCFMLLLQRRYGNVGALAACWLAVGMAINLAVGRLPFALGLAFGLLALAAYDRSRVVPAIISATLTSLASPVAGLFLSIALVGMLIDLWLRRRRGETVRLRVVVGMLVGCLGPVAVTAVLFPNPGVFPFRAGAFVGVMLSLLVLVVVIPPTERVLRIAAGVAALAAIPVFFVGNPLGGNLTRLSVLFVAPLLAAALWQHRRRVVVLAAVPLAFWMVLPGLAGARMHGDPAADPDYHQPLLDFVAAASGVPGRVEIPFTDEHWEVAYVAAIVPIARGWERQVDIDRNAILYEPTLTIEQYRDWLDANAVRWIAIPDVAFDEGGLAEVALIERGIPWLRLARTTDHWQIWEVANARPIVEAPGRLVSAMADEILIAVDQPGTVVVRAQFTPYWTAEGVEACVASSADGILEVEVSEPGLLELRAKFSLAPALTASTPDACPDADATSGSAQGLFEVGDDVAWVFEAD